MKKHLDFLNLIRVVLCFAVLLYHLNILQGGFLAVCGFFVVSGFLLASSLDKEDFDYPAYYKKRLIRIYIPMVIVVFTTIGICGFLNTIWVSIKPETFSVLGLYNNYYKIATSSDYFAGAKETPFLHLWYVAILLQFQIIYPLIVAGIKKYETKHHLKFTVYALYVPVLLSIVFFFLSFYMRGISKTYYGTLARIFSLLIGIAAYYSSKHFKLHLKLKKQITIFYSTGVALLAMMIFIKSDSPILPAAMLVFSLMIAATMIVTPDLTFSEDSKLSHVINWFSDISYEMYLLHYPIIYLWYALLAKDELSPAVSIAILVITVLAAKLLSFVCSIRLNSKFYILALCYALALIPAAGVVKFIAEKDHVKEMAELEQQINSNLEDLAKKQQDYLKKIAENNKEWEDKLSKYSDENYEENRIADLAVTSIGDSVMLGASPWIRAKLPNLYCDAVVSRPGTYTKDILSNLADQGILGDAVVIHIGANGGLHEKELDEVIAFLDEQNRPSFWLTVTDDHLPGVFCNDDIRAACEKYESAHLIDWEVLSANHPDWFVFDGIHLMADGAEAYSIYIYQSIHDYFFDIYSTEKNQVFNEYNQEENNKFSFYGNDILVSCYDNLSASLTKASFFTETNINFDSLKSKLEKDIAEKTITRNIILLLDMNAGLSKENYTELMNILQGRNVYVLSSNKDDSVFEMTGFENLKTCDLTELLDSNSAYTYFDRIHLTEEGSKAVSEYIISILKGL